MPDKWQPGFHDPSIAGWVITAGYLIAAVFAFILARRYRPDKTAMVWLCLGLGLFFLCLNKQLDLQTWLGVTGRDLTKEHGLYRFKNLIRYAFMAGLVVVACVPLVAYRFRIWALLSRAPLAAVGLVLIGLFIVMRGAYLEPAFLPGGRQWIVEAAGLALVLCSFGTRVFARDSR